MEVKIMSAMELKDATEKGLSGDTIVISLVSRSNEIMIWMESGNECFETYYCTEEEPDNPNNLPLKHYTDKSLYKKIIDAYSYGHPMIIESLDAKTLAPALFMAIGELFYGKGMIVFENKKYDPDITVYNTAYLNLKKMVDKSFRVNSGEREEKDLRERIYEKAEALHDTVLYGSIFMDDKMIEDKRRESLWLLRKAREMIGNEEIDDDIDDLIKEIEDEMRIGSC